MYEITNPYAASRAECRVFKSRKRGAWIIKSIWWWISFIKCRREKGEREREHGWKENARTIDDNFEYEYLGTFAFHLSRLIDSIEYLNSQISQSKSKWIVLPPVRGVSTNKKPFIALICVSYTVSSLFFVSLCSQSPSSVWLLLLLLLPSNRIDYIHISLNITSLSSN